jgi:hypothetical protein
MLCVGFFSNSIHKRNILLYNINKGNLIQKMKLDSIHEKVIFCCLGFIDVFNAARIL